MTNVVKLKRSWKNESYWDLCNPKPEMITVKKQAHQYNMRVLDQLNRMTLWDRIFNWPYGRE